MPRRRSARSKSSPDPFTFLELPDIPVVELPDTFTCEFDPDKPAFKLTKPASHKDKYLEEFLNQDRNPALSADRLILVHGELGDDDDYDDPTKFKCENVVERNDGSSAQPQDWLCEYRHDGEDVPFILSEVVSVFFTDEQGEQVGDPAFLPPRHYSD